MKTDKKIKLPRYKKSRKLRLAERDPAWRGLPRFKTPIKVKRRNRLWSLKNQIWVRKYRLDYDKKNQSSLHIFYKIPGKKDPPLDRGWRKKLKQQLDKTTAPTIHGKGRAWNGNQYQRRIIEPGYFAFNTDEDLQAMDLG